MRYLIKPINKTIKFIIANKDWLFALLCLVLFTLIAENVWGKEKIAFDSFIYNGMQNIISPANTVLFKSITSLASTEVIIFFCILLLIFIRGKKYGFLIILNLINTTVLNMLLKTIFARPRPSNIYLVEVSGYSFPSGHAMTSAAFYGFIIYLIWQTDIRKKLKIASTVFLSILIILIGVSRVYLGVHYTSDIAAAFLVSIAYLIGFTKLTSIYLKGDNKKMNRKSQNNSSLINSFRCAFNGIKISFESGRNIIIHYIIAMIVILVGIFLKISLKEWITCIILFGLVISMEMINTALETIVNLVTPQINPMAKKAKDLSAGAVLVIAIAAAAAGLIIFIPKILHLLN